jgi:electron transfer flavoprotein alpha subunit
MSIVCIIEFHNNEVKHGSLEVLSTARGLKEAGMSSEIVALVPGNLADAATLGKWGADRVLQVSALDGPYSSDGWASGLGNVIKSLSAKAILISATSCGRDLAPRISAELDASQISECIEMNWQDGALNITRPLFAGKVLAKTSIKEFPAVLTLRAKVFEATETENTANLEDADAGQFDMRAVVKEIVGAASAKLDLTEADIIVSGGRGVGGSEGYTPLEALAEKLGAVVGASRASVDAGWRPHSDQVGQTGKVVNPTLYIACGISGAIQHLAGMKSSKYIVAVNKDPDAPIFKVADYGIVGDLFEVIPALSASL